MWKYSFCCFCFAPSSFGTVIILSETDRYYWQARKRTLFIATCILLAEHTNHIQSQLELHLEELREMREYILMKIFPKWPFATMLLTKLTRVVPSFRIRYNLLCVYTASNHNIYWLMHASKVSDSMFLWWKSFLESLWKE